MLGQCFGSDIFSQPRKALRRNSSIQSGSPFFSEMRRTVSSVSPLGITSDSMSVTKPYLYSLFVSSSIVLILWLLPVPSTNSRINFLLRALAYGLGLRSHALNLVQHVVN